MVIAYVWEICYGYTLDLNTQYMSKIKPRTPQIGSLHLIMRVI